MGMDEQFGQELLDTKAQHQRELQNHEGILNTIMAELEANKEARERQERQIADLTAAVTTLMGQLKGKRSNPTPERGSAATGGGGGGRPPSTRHGAAGGTPDPGDSVGRGSDDERRGRRDERPDKRNKKPAEKETTDDEKYGQATADEIIIFQSLRKGHRRNNERLSSTPVRVRTCRTPGYPVGANHRQGFFDRNRYQWQDEADRIKYALSKLKGSLVASFTMTYRNQMPGRLAHIRQDGYELCDIFAKQAVRRFGHTHEEEKALREMLQV